MNKINLVYTNHALIRAQERGIKKLPVTILGAKEEYSVDGRKTVYSFSNGLQLAVITDESVLVVKSVWIKNQIA